MSWMTRSTTVFVSVCAPGSVEGGGCGYLLQLKAPNYTRVWPISWRVGTSHLRRFDDLFGFLQQSDTKIVSICEAS